MRKTYKHEAYFHIDNDSWLWDPNIRMLRVEERVFLFELKGFLAERFPFGYCAEFHLPKLCQDEAKQRLLGVTYADVTSMGIDRLKRELAYKRPLQHQLAVARSLEHDLHLSLTQYAAEEIKEYLQALLDVGIIFRNADGFLYDPELVDQFRQRITNYRNRKRNGNSRRFRRRERPLRKAVGANRRCHSVSASVSAFKLGGSPVSTKMGKPASLTPALSIGNASVIGAPENESRTAEQIPAFNWRDCYVGGYEAAKRQWLDLDEQSYESWHRFVSYIVDRPEYHEIFTAEMVTPGEFVKFVAEHNFTPDKWNAVIERILATGLTTKHKLYHRLPQFLGYVRADEERTKNRKQNPFFPTRRSRF